MYGLICVTHKTKFLSKRTNADRYQLLYSQKKSILVPVTLLGLDCLSVSITGIQISNTKYYCYKQSPSMGERETERQTL
jgi:hypothetical protein